MACLVVGSEARRETECTLFMAFHILNNLFVSCICVANLISCAANLLNMTMMMANIITIYRGSVCASETAWVLYACYICIQAPIGVVHWPTSKWQLN